MLAGLRTVFMATIGTALAGAIIGVLLGALLDNYLLWTGLLAGAGACMGLAFAYGFLPER